MLEGLSTQPPPSIANPWMTHRFHYFVGTVEANTEISIPITPGIQAWLILSIWLPYWWLIVIADSTCPSQQGETFIIQMRSCHPSAPTLYRHPISCSIQLKFSPWAYPLLPLWSHLLLFCLLPTLLTWQIHLVVPRTYLHTSVSGPLHVLFSLPGMIFSQILAWLVPSLPLGACLYDTLSGRPSLNT